MVMAEYVPRTRTPIKVGFYDILRTIGRGNFAVVKLARHRITKTEVAIKIIDKLRLDQLNLEKIYREIQILKLLNHQHIIKLYQVMETSSTIYLVCEYARNGELFDYITEQGRLPEDKAKKMFWQVLTAVEYCHKNNVVHRDLKAENLLLDSNNNIKLADFGFGNFYQSGNMLSTWCGSPPYAAPEVFEGKLYDGPHLDVWSLGVVLYVLVCGTFPFDGSNLATLKDRVLGGRFRIPYWMSQDCENLVRHMLVINPKKRLTIAQIKKHNWMRECNPSLVLAQTKSSPSLPRRGKLSEYNEHVLKIMQGLGMNRLKALESLNLSAYDHLYAIYHLLADRLKVHRTSFPLEANISYDARRRRPSNVAEQALSSMTHTPVLPIHHEFNKAPEQTTQEKSTTTAQSEVQFDDMTAGLPIVQHSLIAPIRYASPLPQIRTSMYEETRASENATIPYGSPLDMSYLPCQNDDSSSIASNNPQNSQFLTVDYRQRKRGMDEPKLGNYNLYQRRHTLMVPNPSQLQMLRMGLGSGDQMSSQLSPHTSVTKLNKSGGEMAQANLAENLFPTYDQASVQNCDGITCNNPGCGCKHTGADVSTKTGNFMFPCKNLPLSPDITFNRHRPDIRPQLRRKSGVPAHAGHMIVDRRSRTGEEFETPESKEVFITRQRRQLESSPIGFREGRRASDGLLLLGDNMLKEHLQKLSRTKAVPEMMTEGSEDTWETEGTSQEKNHLQVPNPVNRTNSAERKVPRSQSSPSATPVGSGSNISYQPYNNNQSLARRRSLQAQHPHIRNATTPAHQQHEAVESPAIPNHNQPYGAKISSTLLQGGTERSGYLQLPTNVNDATCQWSSWKPVQMGSPSQGNNEVSSSMWQQISKMKSDGCWKEGDMSNFVVASDEAVSSKVAAAQQEQQRESMTKPLRQQSLPITPASTNHPFGHHQSLAQILQQRRLQRRLKVAATHQQQPSGYQLALPELELLRIDNAGAFGHLQTVPGNPGIESLPHNLYPMHQNNEHEWVSQWRNLATQFDSTVNAKDMCDNTYANEEMFNFRNIDQSEGSSTYQGLPSQAMVSNAIPIAVMDVKSNGQFSWSYDVPSIYHKSLEFDNGILAGENLSSSAERLECSSAETMEFAMY